MRILFVVDARSPIAMNWIRHFIERGDEVYIGSTFPVQLDLPIKRLEVFPVAFSSLKRSSQRPGSASARTLGLRTKIRQWFGPLTIRRPAQRLRGFIEEVKPDLVHAMRIPYEGMLAADAYNGTPLVVSTWGNDFTLHAPSTPLMRHYTRWTMSVADGLHSDCHRDVRLAKQWGFSVDKPSLVAPGNGGIRSDVFYPPETLVQEPVILNPRGVRPYVRNDSFFKAIPLVLEKHPNAKFLCTGMQGEAQAVRWTKELGIEGAVELLAPVPNAEMADLYRRAQILVSPSIHDGTPNTLLEGMACGCFPVAGDLESIREWITPNENGLLFDSTNPQSIAEAIMEGIENKDLREKAAGLNGEIISARAEYGNNMLRAEGFYKRVIR
ncbi:MAG TPA: glycosyltransferase family 4 protein [Anaerolineales bacterium]|nr:glycosyltransferase family 4 protein [Anaerolineales bacterium]